MVIFTIGAVVVGGVIAAASYDDYSDHSDYSCHSDYSDAAEKERIRKEAQRKENDHKKEEIAQKLNRIKNNDMMEFIKDTEYKNISPDSITDETMNKMNRAVMDKINTDRRAATDDKTKYLQNEINAIENAITELEKIKDNLNSDKQGDIHGSDKNS